MNIFLENKNNNFFNQNNSSIFENIYQKTFSFQEQVTILDINFNNILIKSIKEDYGNYLLKEDNSISSIFTDWIKKVIEWFKKLNNKIKEWIEDFFFKIDNIFKKIDKFIKNKLDKKKILEKCKNKNIEIESFYIKNRQNFIKNYINKFEFSNLSINNSLGSLEDEKNRIKNNLKELKNTSEMINEDKKENYPLIKAYELSKKPSDVIRFKEKCSKLEIQIEKIISNLNQNFLNKDESEKKEIKDKIVLLRDITSLLSNYQSEISKVLLKFTQLDVKIIKEIYKESSSN